MKITFTESESFDLFCALRADIKRTFAGRHCWNRPIGSMPAQPERTAMLYREIRRQVALTRRVMLAREREFDRAYGRPPCRDLAELRRRNAEYRTRERIRRDARALKFIPLAKAA